MVIEDMCSLKPDIEKHFMSSESTFSSQRDALSKLVELSGMTEYELAKKFKCSLKAFNSICANKSKMTKKLATALEEEFGVPIDYWDQFRKNTDDVVPLSNCVHCGSRRINITSRNVYFCLDCYSELQVQNSKVLVCEIDISGKIVNTVVVMRGNC